MNTLSLAWQAISPDPVEKGNLIAPDPTDRFAPRPWLHFPPGAVVLLLACAVVLFVAAFQSSVAVVRREGLQDGLEDAGISLPIAQFVPAARQPEQHHRHHRQQANKLHVLLDKSHSSISSWSREGS